jgi:chemotaxis protein histidine kinase CheA
MQTDKYLKNKQTKQSVNPSQTPSHATEDNRLTTGAAFAGVEIHEYAKNANIGVDAVWDLIKRGELVVRNVHGRLMICDDPETVALITIPEQKEKKRDGMIPLLSLEPGAASTPELAVLLDHLSLAREENREVLRMSQESLERISTLADQLLAAKNELIKKKDEELIHVRQELNSQQREAGSLRREMEDLRMLVATLANSRTP